MHELAVSLDSSTPTGFSVSSSWAFCTRSGLLCSPSGPSDRAVPAEPALLCCSCAATAWRDEMPEVGQSARRTGSIAISRALGAKRYVFSFSRDADAWHIGASVRFQGRIATAITRDFPQEPLCCPATLPARVSPQEGAARQLCREVAGQRNGGLGLIRFLLCRVNTRTRAEIHGFACQVGKQAPAPSSCGPCACRGL